MPLSIGRSFLACVALTVAAGACGSRDAWDEASPPPEGPAQAPDADPASKDPAIAAKLVEKPWEVISNKGETYLPNVFYADPSENEQIMPYALDGHVQIDRLVYPTLGNPNLYTKADARDELVTVLRIEPSAYAFLGLEPKPVQGSPLSRLAVTDDRDRGFVFFLVPRSIRDGSTDAKQAITGNGTYRIAPRDVLVSSVPGDMPARLKERSTIRFVFDQKAMSAVPPGLYDLRFELRAGGALDKGIYEYQYNAVRVFDAEPDEYKVVNVTDTQVSIGSSYAAKTKAQLEELLRYVSTTDDPSVRGASFITFNGDLHNGGSPGSLLTRTVATTYAGEAKAIVGALKNLPLPIFLVAGNHDGYVSIGQVPDAVRMADANDNLEKVVNDATPHPWKDFSWTEFKRFLDVTAQGDALGGIPRDLVTGGFSRRGNGATFSEAWREIPRERRNFILYDGFHQWQKTYGPLYYSHKFGKNTYVSLNSFELRQHRRAGWGMFTVNYGGGMTDAQMAWLDRELVRAKVEGSDVVLLAHHDPRGGHKGKDLGYYYDQLRFRSVYQSAYNYLVHKAWNAVACELPDWAVSTAQEESCIHDGLQEWMRPDEDYDCAWDDRGAEGTCRSGRPLFWSGLELMMRLTKSAQIRTVLLGHTHFNSLEVLQAGDELVPGKMPMDGASIQRFASLEVTNPIRGFALQGRTRARFSPDYDRNALPFAQIAERTARFAQLYEQAVPEQRFLDAPLGGPRELVVLRLVSNADLANQTYQGKSALGFSVLHVTRRSDARSFAIPQVNKATFFVNVGGGGFTNIRTVDIDRADRLAAHDASSPLSELYSW